MKTSKVILSSILLILWMIPGAMAQENKKWEQVEIQTSAQCEACKERIEKALSFEKGIKKVDLDLDTKKIKVDFDPKKTDADKIRAAISKAGYDADTIASNPKSYEKLPACCKKGGHK